MKQDLLFDFNDKPTIDPKLIAKTKAFLKVLADAKYRLSVSEQAQELLREWESQ